MIKTTEALIEMVGAIGGSFYLPYRLHARADQIAADLSPRRTLRRAQATLRSRASLPQPDVGHVFRRLTEVRTGRAAHVAVSLDRARLRVRALPCGNDQLHSRPDRRGGARLRYLRARHLRRPAALRLRRLGARLPPGCRGAPASSSCRRSARSICSTACSASSPAPAISISASCSTACSRCRFAFKIFANLPHIALGGFAMFAGFLLAALAAELTMRVVRWIAQWLKRAAIALVVLVRAVGHSDRLERDPVRRQPARKSVQPIGRSCPKRIGATWSTPI